MTREQLIEEAKAFDATCCGTIGRCEYCLADFAENILERESVYREICEAATSISVNGLESLIFKTSEGYLARRVKFGECEQFPTLLDAYHWVKEGGKDD